MCLPRLPDSGRTGTAGVALLAKLVQQNLRNGVQGGKNILPGTGDDLEALHPLLPVVQDVIEVIDRSDIWQMAFVVLQDVGDIVERHVLLGQVVLQIFETLNVFLHFFPLRIGYENDAIDAAQDELAGGVVNYLTRDGIELEFGDKALDNQSVERKKVEEQSAIGCGGERNEVAAILRINPLMDVTEIGSFATEGRTVINDLKLDLAAGVINDRHEESPLWDRFAKVPV